MDVTVGVPRSVLVNELQAGNISTGDKEVVRFVRDWMEFSLDVLKAADDSQRLENRVLDRVGEI